MQGESNQPQPVGRLSQPIITKFLESPAVESALPIMRASDEARDAMLAGRPAPLSGMAIQVHAPASVGRIASGVTDQLLQRVADQDVATLLQSNARVIPIREAAQATGLSTDDPADTHVEHEPGETGEAPSDWEAELEPVALERIAVEQSAPEPSDDVEPAPWEAPEAGCAAQEPERVETIPDREPAREMGTMFSRWRQSRLAHTGV